MWLALDELAWHTQKIEAQNASKLKIRLEKEEAERVSQMEEQNRP